MSIYSGYDCVECGEPIHGAFVGARTPERATLQNASKALFAHPACVEVKVLKAALAEVVAENTALKEENATLAAALSAQQ